MPSTEAAKCGSVSDWFLGGSRRRALLRALYEAPRSGLTVEELHQQAGCAKATAYEVVTALRDLDLLASRRRPYSYGIDRSHPLARPLRCWLDALDPYAEQPVLRPRRGKRSS